MRFWWIGVMLAGAAQAQTRPPGSDSPPPDRVLETARSWATNYAATLPDFLCTEFIRRYANWQGPEYRLDTLTLQLGFNNKREGYRLVARDGHPTHQTVQSLNGSFSSGEFGSALFLIFDFESAAVFAPEPPERIRRRKVAVYSFAVPQARSHYKLQYGAQEIMTAYHGRVYIDMVTNRVLRLTMAVDPPSDFPIQETTTTLDYDWRDVGGAQYLLPVRADVRTTEHVREDRGTVGNFHIKQLSNVPMRYHNIVEFRDYHKFATESKLGFGQ